MASHHYRFGENENRGAVQESLLGGLNAEREDCRRAIEQYTQKHRVLLEKFLRYGHRRLEEKEREILFRDGVRLVEELSASVENPTNPRRKFLRDFRLAIADTALLQGEDRDLLKIYSSVGTPLDKIFGVDFFIRLDSIDKKREPVYVTCDYSLRGKDAHETGADLVIPELPGDETQYGAAVRKDATKVYEVLLRRRMTRGNRPWV